MSKNSLHLWKFMLVFVLGALWFIGLRFILLSDDSVHYHANFAVYIDDQAEPFDSFTFYEEVAACSPSYSNVPQSRAHMHDSVAGVVHVHDEAVTWSNFFDNIGYTLGQDVLSTVSQTMVSGQDDKQLRFILNGQFVRDASSLVIESEDALLVDYSDAADSELQSRYEGIVRSAAEYNLQDDPSSCSGSEADSFGERLKRAIGIE